MEILLHNNFKKLFLSCLVAIGCLTAFSVYAKEKHSKINPSRFELETMLVWYEARNQSPQVQQLVLDTAHNRRIMCSCSLYEVLTEPNQYPWTKKLKTWKLSTEQAEFGFKFLSRRSPVNSDFIYFNHEPLTFTKKNVKHGSLYFAVK